MKSYSPHFIRMSLSLMELGETSPLSHQIKTWFSPQNQYPTYIQPKKLKPINNLSKTGFSAQYKLGFDHTKLSQIQEIFNRQITSR